MQPVKVGIVGCGAISGQYLQAARHFPQMQIVALADLHRPVAEKRAAEFGIGRVLGVDELLRDDDVELVLNLTVPKAHVPIALQAIVNGKHTYAEKPLGIDREEGRQVLELARAKQVRVGCAPDTFMGAGIQTARKLIDDGAIGRPVAFTAYFMGAGHESWHPSPEFYYEVGGGPMFDMGPYYLTALLNFFGPVKRLNSVATVTGPTRTITSEPKKGTVIPVETPDHIAGTMEFENGVVGTLITSFAAPHADYTGHQPITVFGTDGTLRVPDPNAFDGPVAICPRGKEEFVPVPHAFVTGYGRSVGLADMSVAIRTGRAHRASGQQGFAVLDLMAGFLDASRLGKDFVPSPGYQRPAPMVADLPFGMLDE